MVPPQNARTVAALFVERNGCYWNIDGVDPWDKERDARLYDGPWPVVAHPPCARWSKLAGLVEARGGSARGQDDGCFAAALDSVRKYGGVLEHPASSSAWPHFDLPSPLDNGWIRGLCGGWSCQVAQGAYGHRATKLTWLYAFNVTYLPSLDWRVVGGEHAVELMGKRERMATPLPFRDLLLEISRSVP